MSTEPRATVQAIWRGRPSRRQSDRKIAGVCAAIARRYDVDPVLVRIAFVVAAFYGVGILLYLAAWMALPTDPEDPPTGWLYGRTGSLPVHPLVVVAAVIAGLFAIGSLIRGNPGVLVGLAVAGGLLYLLHENRGERGRLGRAADTGTLGAEVSASRGTGGAPHATTASAMPGIDAEERREPTPPTAPAATAPAATAPTASAPAGSAGLTASAEPPPASPPPGSPHPSSPPPGSPPPGSPPPGSPPPGSTRHRSSVLTPVTIGVALLAGGITGALVLIGQGPSGPRLVVGVMLAVVGLGLVAGAFLRRGGALLFVAVPLLLVGYAASRAGSIDFRPTGDMRIAPTTVNQLAPSYRHGFGDVTVDLRNLDLSVPPPPNTETQPPAQPGSAPQGQPRTAPPTQPGTAPQGQPRTAPPTQPGTAPQGQPRTAPPTQPGSAPPGQPGAQPAAPVPPPPTGAPVHTRITAQAGDVVVLLPPNADVTVHCRAGIGEVDCLGQNMDGRGADVRAADLGADHTASGRALDIEVEVGAGEVRVTRG